MNTIDVIILSYARTPDLRAVTENCLSSLLLSEDHAEIDFRILVIESQKNVAPYEGRSVETFFPDAPFGYHAYMNIGIQRTSAPYVCLCNNDLHFHKGWAKAILDALAQNSTLQSTSPLCSIHHPTVGISFNSGLHFGYEIRKEVTGWCLFFRREMLKITGPLDETFKFWFADNDYAKTLASRGVQHALVSTSVVDHLESKTLNTHSAVQKRLLTNKAKLDFEHKWNGLRGAKYLRKLAQFYIKLSICFVREHLGSSGKNA